MKKILFSALTLAFSSVVLAVGNPKIADDAVIPVTKQSDPNIVRKLGHTAIPRINNLFHKAAERAALDPVCDKVKAVNFSMQRSVASGFVVFVDCVNKRRIYFDEIELSLPPLEEPKTPIDIKATAACEIGVINHLDKPEAFRRKKNTTIIRINENDGNRIVRFSFELKDPVGEIVARTAICTMNNENVIFNTSVVKEVKPHLQ